MARTIIPANTCNEGEKPLVNELLHVLQAGSSGGNANLIEDLLKSRIGLSAATFMIAFRQE
jgi:hypothetical protein